ncbi:MAG: glycosyl hydrolase [Kiritimatiellae bacterium]|nr:glycosyl hydrolase [Kiritimatiellia bacterium]
MNVKIFMIAAVLIGCGGFNCAVSNAAELDAGFRNPPRAAGVRCWWWWLNSNVTKEAITRDLQAMHDKGFSGAMIFDANGSNQRGNVNVPNGPMYGSEEWTDLYLHALREAERLDLKIGLSIQSGWNLGGPGVTLDDKAKQVTSAQIQVDGAAEINLKLPVPKANYDYYRDICVLAYPGKGVQGVPFKLTASSAQADHPVENINSGGFWVSGGKESGRGPTSKSPEWIEFTFDKRVAITALNLTGRKGYGPKLGWVEAIDSKQRTKSFQLKDGSNALAFDAIEGKVIRVVFADSYDPSHPAAPRNVQVVSAQLIDQDGKGLTGGGTGNPISNLSAKTGARELGGSAPDCRFLLNDLPATDGEEDTKLGDIIDITDKLSKDGTLKWSAPAGRWIILRIGYTPTGAHVSTSSDSWQGHVLDYLSKDVFNRYWNDVVEPLLKKAGPLAGTVLTELETDSWECGGMNWSPGLAEEFRQYNGYEIVKYLPVVVGKIIESREASNAFLADFRKTIAHCVSENHYKTFAENAARYKIGIQPECSGPHAGPIDGIKNYSHSSIVMSEFWAPSPHRPNPQDRFFVKQASSAAHIYGKQYVGAEAFTTIGPHWNDLLWYSQKPAMDYEFCEGMNMIFFHTFTCSPQEMGLPGQEYFAGTHVNPQVTWWNESAVFINYINRIQSVVQQGSFVADVLYYYGDHVPNIAGYKGFNQAGSLPGYDYDVTNEDILLRLTVADGRIAVPGGVRYRMLVLPDHKVLSLAALKMVESLLAQGATVLGAKPERLVSLVGGAAAQREFHALAAKLWGDNPAEAGQKKVGSGRLVWGQSSRSLLQADGLVPDFEALNAGRQADYEYIHYTIEGADVYFVCNQSTEIRAAELAFRVSGRQPELWNPATGEIRRADAFVIKGERTIVPVSFDPHGSMFVIFREKSDSQGAPGSNFPAWQEQQRLAGPWDLSFDPAWGGPAGPVRYDTLASWTEHSDPGIKYYSGKAVYRTTFTLTKDQTGSKLALELGSIKDVGIAQVTLNNKDLGVLWLAPFRVEISEAAKEGENKLEIMVVNSWQNRVMGDEALPESKRFTQTNIRVTKSGRFKWELEESGLLGAVRIMSH